MIEHRTIEASRGDTLSPHRMGSSPFTKFPHNPASVATDRKILTEHQFREMIGLERKRSERSHMPFLLVLVDTGASLPRNRSEKVLASILDALSLLTRDTDLVGWYEENLVLGVMFTDISNDEKSALVTMLGRVSAALQENLTLEEFSQIGISLHLYPEDWHHELFHRPSNPTLYPDLLRRDESRLLAITIKRAMDIAGSLIALTLASPLFLLIAIAIKLTSKGPVFFRQQRVGQYGRSFMFLKFRSMHVSNDTSVHKEWFNKFRNGKAQRQPTNGQQTGSFKMTNDPRITRVGRILRRTSLDELPQFVNVLRGEMSLVGPRPPIPYEVDDYLAWHRGRILEAKPGLTGLWQVNGRSRVTFDEMVRLDLQYARTWSIWLDIKILLKTPKAVISGDGAY
jgi:exopolysaccharide biosynthesis polyprenyl glycosylphosphotransferase